MIRYEKCPVCDAHIFPVLSVADHSVSGEEFPVWECRSCSLRFTQDIPGPDEIGRYYKSDDYISHTETREGLVNRAYHMVRKFTLQQKRSLVCSAVAMKNGRVLDIGCGTGAFLKEMQDNHWEVLGLEPDQGARELAIGRGVPVRPSGDLYGLEEAFDAITMWHVLEHVHDLHGYMKKIYGLLSLHGRFFIAVPNYTSRDAKHYGTFWAAYDVPRHLYHFSPRSMKTLAMKHGFELEGIRPMWFDSVYVSMLSEKYRKGNLLSAVVQGMLSNLSAVGNTGACSSVIYVLKKPARQ